METQQIKNNENSYLVMFFHKQIRIYKKEYTNFSKLEFYTELLFDHYSKQCRWDFIAKSQAEIDNYANLYIYATSEFVRSKEFDSLENLIKNVFRSKDKRKKYKYVVDFLIGEL